MSHLHEVEIVCPHCRQPNVAEVWSVMNVREDPELKDLLLGGEINMTECAGCSETFFVDAFLIYHDPDNELLASVYPSHEAEKHDTLLARVRDSFRLSQATLPENERLRYEPECFVGIGALVAFVERDDEIALQGEVVEALAREQQWPVRCLQPWTARRQHLPRVLPFLAAPGGTDEDAVLNGLRKLISVNDRLTVYSEVLARLESTHPSLNLSAVE